MKILPVLFGFLICIFLFECVTAIPNPSAVYCRDLGYNYTVLKMEDGSERGICTFPDNTSCAAWDFYAGTCGQNWSYCTQNGMITIAMTDGNDPYSPFYSACALNANLEAKGGLTAGPGPDIVGSVTELMDLSEKLESACSCEKKDIDSIELKECEECNERFSQVWPLQQPAQFNWRSYNGADWITSVKDQDCNDCWAFTTNGGVEAKINIVENDPNFDIDLSEQYLVSDCCPAGDCSGGYNDEALEYIRDSGVTDECCYPYKGRDSSCSGRCDDYSKRLWKIDDYGTINNANDLKNKLFNYGPVASAIYMNGDFIGGVYQCAEDDEVCNHAILIVGYDDQGGFWIVKNSWGADWGFDNDGFFRVPYGECNIGSFGYHNSQYIDTEQKFPEKTTASQFEVTTGSSTGSLSNTNAKDGSYLKLEEKCGILGCDGLASDFTFTVPKEYSLDYLDVVANIKSTEKDFDLNVWNTQTNDWEYVANVPTSYDTGEFEGSTTIHWHMIKYRLCDTEEECHKYIDENRQLRLNFNHGSCVFCNKDNIDIDWLFLGGKKTHFSIKATPEKAGYEPGETAKVTIDVENNEDGENIWLGVSFKDPAGEYTKYNPQITITPESAYIGSGATRTFTAEWPIPIDAPLGGYDIAVNCWKDNTFTDKYTDDLEWESIFFVYDLDIISPITSAPALVGDPTNPAGFNAEVTTGIPLLLASPGSFNARIGNKQASVTVIPSFFDNLLGIYTLQIAPPTQDAEGLYELYVSFNIGEGVSDFDIEQDAVIYSTGGNIDVVEVIDRSGSMSGAKIQAAKDSAKLFVDLMAINDAIGVASYSSGASVNYGLTTITSNTIKQNAKNAINSLSAIGGTSIGAGLQVAYNELVNKGNPSHPQAVVLMSDGLHNTNPHPDTILPGIRNANIMVFTIGLGSGADANLLSHIAHDSGGGGGEYYFSPSSAELSAIYNAIAGVVKAESTVKSVTGSVQQGETINHKVEIDPTITIATFTVTWSSETLTLGLERSDGSKVGLSDPDVLSHIKEATYETYTIENPMVGEWTMELIVPITSSSNTKTISTLTTTVEDVMENIANNTMDDNWSTEIVVPAEIEPAQKEVAQAGISYAATVTAKTNLTVHVYTDEDKYSLNEPMEIITALTKAGSPITGADVAVTVERPDSVKERFSLYDDGKHDDGKALDGIYANHYTNTDISGSYTVTVHASGTASPDKFTREVKKSVYVSSVPAGGISVTPTSWDTGIVHPGEATISAFTVNSTSTKNETVMILATDLMDIDGNVIGSENVICMPSTFVVPAGGYGAFNERIYVPETTKTGNYTGSIVLKSTTNSVNILVTLQAKKLFETNLPNVELLYTDPTVQSINVTCLNLSEVNETCKPERVGCRCAYMINATGVGNFTLRFTNVTDAEGIVVYKINETNQWVELAGITTEDTVTFTMEVGDPPVVFGSEEEILPAQVPTLTPIGLTALIGLILVLGGRRIRKKRRR